MTGHAGAGQGPAGIHARIAELWAAGRCMALATVIRAAGSVPQVPGARLLLADDGRLHGTVGGGRLEACVIEALGEALQSGQARTLHWHLTRDLGMCCGGQVEVFVERIDGAPQLILFGAGHVGHATARIAGLAGFAVTVVDAREDLNTPERFAGAERVPMEPVEAVKHAVLPFGARAYVVIATHDHRLDEEALGACLGHPHAYLGMIGSRRKVIRIFERIRARWPGAALERVHAPIGLSIGALTPEEIAVSIVAELVAVRRGQEPETRVRSCAAAGAGREASR